MASSMAQHAYEGTKYLVQTAHATLGTAMIVGCASTIATVFALKSLYNHFFSQSDHADSLIPESISGRPSIKKTFRGVRVRVITGDITAQHVDIVVNAANEHLTGGGGVDGAIQKAAGPKLAAYCIKNFPVLAMSANGVPIRCPVGEVRVTPAFGLAKQEVKFLIHANGPRGNSPNREKLLASCYQSALTEATRLKAASIAFPAISVGIFGYPTEEATACAVKTVADTIQRNQSNTIREIRFVLYDKDPHYQELLKAYKTAMAMYMPDTK